MTATQFSAFLRSRRARVQPAELGMPAGLRTRRTTGLRREEIATLAGVSVDYYTRLEQGRERNPSSAVLAAIATGLLLGGEERDHLFRLAAHGGNAKRPLPVRAPSREVRPAVRQLLETVGWSPAYVLGRTNDLLAANRAGTALLSGLDQWPAPRRNTVRYIFLHPTARTLFVNWNSIAQGAVAHLRAMAGVHAKDEALTALIEELDTKSEEFASMWRRHDVRSLSTGIKLFDHPKVGRMELNYEVLNVSNAEHRLVVYQAPPGTADHDAMLLLNMVGGPAPNKAVPTGEPSTGTPSARPNWS